MGQLQWPISAQHNKISTKQRIGLIVLCCANFAVLWLVSVVLELVYVVWWLVSDVLWRSCCVVHYRATVVRCKNMYIHNKCIQSNDKIINLNVCT